MLLKTDPVKTCPQCLKEFVKKIQKINLIQGKDRKKKIQNAPNVFTD